jgi:hypothetical protein
MPEGSKEGKQQTSKTTTTHKQKRQGKVNGWPIPQTSVTERRLITVFIHIIGMAEE